MGIDRNVVWGTTINQAAFMYISRVPCTKVLSQSISGFRFLHHPTDVDEPDKPVTSVYF